MSSGDSLDRRSFLTAAGSAAAAATLAGCSGDGGDGGGTEGGDGGDGTGSDGGDGGSDQTLVYARGDHPENYDPQQSTSGEVAKVTNQVFDTLIQFAAGSGGQLEDALATDYTLEGTTATLTLREGVTFHNGEEFTASDFKATWQRFTQSDYEYYLGDDTRSGYGPFTLGDWIESVDASQDYELTIELTQQFAPFLRNLAMFASAVLSKARSNRWATIRPTSEANPRAPGPSSSIRSTTRTSASDCGPTTTTGATARTSERSSSRPSPKTARECRTSSTGPHTSQTTSTPPDSSAPRKAGLRRCCGRTASTTATWR